MSNIDSKKFIKQNPIFSEGYGLVSKIVMQDRRLNIISKGIYAYLCSFAGTKFSCFPSTRKICRDLNVNSDTFYKYIKELTVFGYLKIVKEQKQAGRFRSSIYHIITSPVGNDRDGDVGMDRTEMTVTVKPHTNINNVKSNNLNSNNLEINSKKEIYIDLRKIDDPVIEEYLNQYKSHFGKEHFPVSENYRDKIENLITQTECYDDTDIEKVIEYHFEHLPDGNNGSILYFAEPGYMTRIFDNTDLYEW